MPESRLERTRAAYEHDGIHITADVVPHFVGERAVMNVWTLPDGTNYYNVPLMYIREATREEHAARWPKAVLGRNYTHFWEVSID